MSFLIHVRETLGGPLPGRVAVFHAAWLALILLAFPPGAWGAPETPSEQLPDPRPLFAPVSDNARLGPFQLHDASPFQLLRVTMTPLSTETLARGQFLLNASVTWDNRWGFKYKQYYIDGEFLQFSMAGDYGVTDWLQVRLEIPFGVRGGGVMDSAIMGFHDALGYAQAGRDLFPINRFRLILWRKDGTLFQLGPEDTGIGLEDMTLTARFRLLKGGELLPLTSLSLQMQLPTGNEDQLWGSGSLDGAVAVSLAKRFWRLYFYLDLQYTRFGSDELVGIPMEQNQFSLLFTAEWSIIQRLSFVSQFQWHSSPAVDFYEFSQCISEVALGVKALIAPETVLSFALIENIFFYDNSPDFGFHLGVSHRF
jgi:hypothetical protein